MTTNFTGRDAAISPTDAEGVMFAATPAWERRRKSSRFGGRTTPAEPRTFEPGPSMATGASLPPGATVTPSPLAVGNGGGLAAPISGAGAVRSGGSASPTAIALALGAVVVLGGAGWLALRSQEPVVEMTPASTSSEIAAAPVAPPPEPVVVAENTAPPATVRVAPPEARRTAPIARVRPAAIASADGAAVNASATIPDAPQPYSALNPGAPPQPVNPAAPVIAETAPTAPEAIPSTPPIAPEPAPAIQTPATDMPPT